MYLSDLESTKEEQRKHRISSAMPRKIWGDLEMAFVKVTGRKLEWLGHANFFFVCSIVAPHKEAQGRDGRMCCGEI